jgi:hypothetical protein
MQDSRLRVFSTILLSFTAFFHVYGALLVMLWWLVFTPRGKVLPRPKVLVGLFGMILAVSIIVQLQGGDGVSYMIRMGAIILIAGWAYSERKPGDLLSVSVWLFHPRYGFEIGLIAEMVVQSLQLIEDDIEHLRIALRLKGLEGWRTMIPLAVSLIHTQLGRSKEQAAILAVRGYRGEGLVCPAFASSKMDKFAFLLVLAIVFSVIGYGSDIFILTR